MSNKITKDASLYGIPRAKKRKASDITSTNSLAFTSNLSALIAASSSAPRTAVSRNKQKKDDIFSVHNKNAKKRAAKDLEDNDFTQKHTTSGESLDQETWSQAQKKMEDKARLYNALKRGEVEDADEKYGVDFDRKWAENQNVEESDEDDDGSEEELVEYIDEFGRTRQGTKGEVAREERGRTNGGFMADEPGVPGARLSMPSNVIFGDAIQAAAFDPERDIATKMADLAAKRDKEATPPPDEHFDSKREIRTKGVGFFQFSGDAEERKKQMENLEKERIETEQRHTEASRRKEERKKELEARKKAIAEKRGAARADKFLDALLPDLQDKMETKSPD